MTREIVLPFPDPRLSPNKRSRHKWLTDIRSIARNVGFLAAKEAGVSVPDKTPLHLFLVFNPPDNRRRDGDNINSSLKSYMDGIFSALQVDDSNIRLTTYGFGKRVKGGQVIARLEVLQKEAK